MDIQLFSMELTNTLNPVNHSIHSVQDTTPQRYPKNHNLVEWFLENQCIGSENMKLDFQQHTFRDKDGLLRYMDSWLPAPEDGYPYIMPGCYELQLPRSVESVDESTEKTVSIKVLLDWERLWCHLAADNGDELAMHDALLRASINFFMHENTLYIFWVLFIYDTIIVAAFNVVTGGLTLPGIILTLYIFISGIFYVVLYRLYAGDNSPLPTAHLEDISTKHVNRWTSTRPRNKLWSGSFLHFIGLIVREGREFLSCKSKTKTPPTLKPIKRSVSSFDHLMAIALKYLTQHCEITSKEINLSRRSYKLAFLGLFTGLFAFIIVRMYSDWILVSSVCYAQPEICNLAIIQAILRGGFIVGAMQTYILFGSMSISIIGLSYGSELAYYMVGIWLKRFTGLRRVESNLAFDGYPTSSSTLKHAEEGAVLCDGSIAVHVQRDAVEQYLFIAEYLRQSGAVWSPVIVAMYSYGVFLFLVVNYFFATNSATELLYSVQSISDVALLVFQTVLFLVFPSWSLASANALLAPVLDVFSNSGKDDFKMIGALVVLTVLATVTCYE